MSKEEMTAYETMKLTKEYAMHKMSGGLNCCEGRDYNNFVFCKVCESRNQCEADCIVTRYSNKEQQEQFEKLSNSLNQMTNNAMSKELVDAIEDLARAAAREETYKVLTEIETERKRQGRN